MIVTMAINSSSNTDVLCAHGRSNWLRRPELRRVGHRKSPLAFCRSGVVCPHLDPVEFLFLLNRSGSANSSFSWAANPTAAQLTGVNVNRIRILMCVFSAMLAAFAGMVGAAYMKTARCQIFDEYAFSSLVAVIVGGTAFTGGIGSFAGSMAGALLMTVLSNGLTVLALSQPVRNLVQGVVMILLLIMYNRARAVRQ